MQGTGTSISFPPSFFFFSYRLSLLRLVPMTSLAFCNTRIHSMYIYIYIYVIRNSNSILDITETLQLS